MVIPMENTRGEGPNMQQTGKLSGWRRLALPAALVAAVVAGACH